MLAALLYTLAEQAFTDFGCDCSARNKLIARADESIVKGEGEANRDSQDSS